MNLLGLVIRETLASGESYKPCAGETLLRKVRKAKDKGVVTQNGKDKGRRKGKHRHPENFENRLLTGVKSWEAGEMCDLSVFSPDGGRIAYAWLARDRRYQLRAVNLDDSMIRILHDGEGVLCQTPYGWTADGKHILTVLLDQDRSSRIDFVSATDGSVKVLKEMGYRLPRGSRQLSLSPNGKYIACGYPPREDAGNCDIFVISAAGGQEVMLVEYPADDVVLGWSPDGKQTFSPAIGQGASEYGPFP